MSELDKESTDLVDKVIHYCVYKRYPAGATKNEKRIIRRKAERFEVSDSGELFYLKRSGQKLKYVKQREEQLRILSLCHVHPASGHMGTQKTQARILERFVWPGLTADIENLVRTCDVCQRSGRKLTKAAPELHPVPVVAPWHHIGIDFVGPLSPPSTQGSHYILTISDYFSKLVEAIPTVTKHATSFVVGEESPYVDESATVQPSLQISDACDMTFVASHTMYPPLPMSLIMQKSGNIQVSSSAENTLSDEDTTTVFPPLRLHVSDAHDKPASPPPVPLQPASPPPVPLQPAPLFSVHQNRLNKPKVQHVDLTQSLEGSDIVFNDSFDSLDMSPLDEDILDASKQWLKLNISDDTMLSRPKHSSTPERSFPLLTAKAEAILKSDTMWLDDSHMHAAQTLLKCAFPMQNGLQHTILLEKKFEYKSGTNKFVQIVNVDSLHWVCASNIYCPPGVIEVYDSIPSFSTGSYGLYKQLAAILRCNTDNLMLKFVNVQRQVGTAECGVFAIAFAYALCNGVDPHTIGIDQHASRAHLLKCFKIRALSPFPTMSRPRRMGRKRIIVERKVKVFCTCRLPFSKTDNTLGPMVACQKCKKWYHQCCKNIPSAVYSNVKSIWFCDTCVV